MAAIHELLKQVQDPALRARLTEEFNRATQNKKFGLVFEEHMPECTPLYGVSIKRGGTVAKKASKINDTYTVIKLNGDTAVCRRRTSGETEEIAKSELVAVAEFGEPIFPYLEHIDSVENAPDSDLWHTLIEADNYHALQLLEYLYPQKVDCIYIDPPYNTGAKDWKYNNDYVDSSDAYRHSKWLSMMKKRLALAKRLLNPEDSVLIVTIDEKEYLHLGCLLEEMFPEARMQMISSVINPKGQSRDGLFGRTDEYLFFVLLGNAKIQNLPLETIWRSGKSTTTNDIRWQYLRRPGITGQVFRENSPGCYYPIFINNKDLSLHSIGEALPLGVSKDTIIPPEGTTAVWPIRTDGKDGCYQVSPEKCRKLYDEGFLHITEATTSGIHYLKAGECEKVRKGVYKILGYRENDHSVIVESQAEAYFIPGTQWNIPTHNAGDYGKKIINDILAGGRFTYPKSLYAVKDALQFVVANNPNALIVDFFAGSGTTLHAVNLLNKEDGGHRRCIVVTNNEVSEAEKKELDNRGFQPGDEEWEKLGIARYVTWPRTVCSIEGHDVNGNPLKGNYIGSDIPMADGFAANCEYFKLGFLDRDMVSLGQQFREILPLLWMKSGAIGKHPEYTEDEEPLMLVLPENHFAILVEEAAYSTFAKEIRKYDTIDTIYFVTNSESAYHEMSEDIGYRNTYQLYRDYIDNFVIGARRDRL